ncbi:MAG: hypothetical protein CTY39_02670 [Hyphomicrobium sp.]|nr:MAG: hypothetical protein CTY39_02670 [Hyphomicrobium sp.]
MVTPDCELVNDACLEAANYLVEHLVKAEARTLGDVTAKLKEAKFAADDDRETDIRALLDSAIADLERMEMTAATNSKEQSH